jgi:hypothetical protein
LRQEYALFNLRPSKEMGELDQNSFRLGDNTPGIPPQD